MRYVILGKTGLKVSELGFGGIPLIRLNDKLAVEVLRRAYEKGVTLYDTANMYLDSEEKIGMAFRGLRDKVVIASKSIRRDAAGMTEHIEKSLHRLKTDYIDLYQLHQVSEEKDWNAIMAPGGAMEALLTARDKGKILYIGVSSHSLAMAIKLAKTDLFSTIQFPFNFIEIAAKDELHKVAQERQMGILAMKPFAGGMIDDAAIAFKFLRLYPAFIPIPGFDSVEAVDQVAALYEIANEINQSDLDTMDRYRIELGKQFCRRCEYCQPCPNGVLITPAMGYRVIALRMSPDVAVKFSSIFMESVLKCDRCGECLEKCPYDLPIPDMLKTHYDLYEKHRKGLLNG
ncbi:MAG: aldo/keto reductase [Deltaproteobacteria bacterium HGW-Deltaproteobacteria-10]|nr:MAG: aldo/keto reductase [Deltaproteobacteria bacterium HGW-Deltaproteobacteria-10]